MLFAEGVSLSVVVEGEDAKIFLLSFSSEF